MPQARYRLGVVSDIHGDLGSLDDALRLMDERRCDQIVCLGDLVDYGPRPNGVVEMLRQRGISTIRGNHCRWALANTEEHPELSDQTLAWLATLPTSWRTTWHGTVIVAHHGSPRSDMDDLRPEWTTPAEYERHLDRTEADVLLLGHTHVPMAVRVSGNRLVANPGALLRDPVVDPHRGAVDSTDRAPGTFGVLELPTKKFTVYRSRDGSAVDLGG